MPFTVQYPDCSGCCSAGISVGCAPEALPTTIHATFQAINGAACVDNITEPLIYNTLDFIATWEAQSNIDCPASPNAVATSLSCVDLGGGLFQFQFNTGCAGYDFSPFPATPAPGSTTNPLYLIFDNINMNNTPCGTTSDIFRVIVTE